MRLLFDTHILLWAALASSRLTTDAVKLLEDPGHEKHFSVVSIWEVGIKSSLGRANFSIDPNELRSGLLANGYKETPILGAHALIATRLPTLHKDPFDRMLVAQALADNLTLVTSDATVAAYSPSIRKI